MDTDILYIDGMFKTNTDLVKKATDGIRPEHWFLKSDVGRRTSCRQPGRRAQDAGLRVVGPLEFALRPRSEARAPRPIPWR